jgi:hypothetical protein
MKRAIRPIGTIRSGAVFILSPSNSPSARIDVPAATTGRAKVRGKSLSGGHAPHAAATEIAASGVIAR